MTASLVTYEPFIGIIVSAMVLYALKIKANNILLYAILMFFVSFIALFLGGAFGELDTGATPKSDLHNTVYMVLIIEILILLFIVWRHNKKSQ